MNKSKGAPIMGIIGDIASDCDQNISAGGGAVVGRGEASVVGEG